MAATMANSPNAASAMMMPRKMDGVDRNGIVKTPPIHTSPHANGRGSAGSASSVMSMSSRPTLIATPRGLRFLIMDAPRQSNLHLFIKECRRGHVTDMVRVCEPTYLGSELASAGIKLHEMAYDDGQSPPEEVLGRWLALVENRFFGSDSSRQNQGVVPEGDRSTIAVHCVAGLGRAPVLVAIALMEFEGMDAIEAVTMIRRERRGAINGKQLHYLEGYKCRRRAGGGACACVIM